MQNLYLPKFDLTFENKVYISIGVTCSQMNYRRYTILRYQIIFGIRGIRRKRKKYFLEINTL